MLLFIRKLCKVSVPIQGTYLPFALVSLMAKFECISVPIQGTYLPFEKEAIANAIEQKFPSPFRGLIFHSLIKDWSVEERNTVSVPIQGTYLPFFLIIPIILYSMFPSPFRGLIFHSKSMQMLVKRQ